MKKILFVVVALGLSSGFAKNTKENKARKPNQVSTIDQDAVKAACDILSSSLLEAGAVCQAEVSGRNAKSDDEARSTLRVCVQSVASDCSQQYSK